jgi:cardiolipin synthase
MLRVFTPNFFTVFRLLASIVIVLLYIIFGVESFAVIFPLYIFAAVSDYIDGNLARKYNKVTNFGKCFDIIADKALVLAIFMIATHAGSVHLFFSFVILFREFAVSGLREVLAAENVKIPASRLGKWKTGFQMTTCGFAIGMYTPWVLSLLNWTVILVFVPMFVTQITFILLVISTFLTVWSGGEYFRILFGKNKI